MTSKLYAYKTKMKECCDITSLSAYDDLIENNRRRIQLLEESARLLYREWSDFVSPATSM